MGALGILQPAATSPGGCPAGLAASCEHPLGSGVSASPLVPSSLHITCHLFLNVGFMIMQV